MQIIEDEQPFFSFISKFFIDIRLINPACDWTGEKGSVVYSPHVVTCSSKTKWYPQNKNCGINPRRVIPRG